MNTLIIAKMTKVTYDDWKIKFDVSKVLKR